MLNQIWLSCIVMVYGNNSWEIGVRAEGKRWCLEHDKIREETSLWMHNRQEINGERTSLTSQAVKKIAGHLNKIIK